MLMKTRWRQILAQPIVPPQNRCWQHPRGSRMPIVGVLPPRNLPQNYSSSILVGTLQLVRDPVDVLEGKRDPRIKFPG